MILLDLRFNTTLDQIPVFLTPTIIVGCRVRIKISNSNHLLKEAGLNRVRFHDLRHTAASLMLNNRVDVLVASRRLGHAKPSITLDVYGHLIPSIQAEAADVMDRLVVS